MGDRNRHDEHSAAKRQEFVYVVEAYDGKRFRKVRGPEGGPWL